MNLYDLEKKENIEGLIDKLDSENSAVRTRAAELLGEVGEGDTLEVLVDTALEDENKETRKAAAKALAISGAAGLLVGENQENPSWSITQKLIEALNSNDAAVRSGASLALGFSEDKRSVDPLISLLKDKDPDVRKNATWALTNIGYKGSSENIAKLLNDKSSAVRKQAAESLAELNSGIEELIEAFQDEKDKQVKKKIASSLGNVKGKEEKRVKALAQNLDDKNSEVRKESIYSLIQTVSEAKKESHKLREKALRSLEATEESSDPVIDLIENTNNKRVKRNATWILGHIGGEEAVDPLIDALKQEDERLRMFAATSLAQIGEEAVESLIDILDKNDPQVRKMACFSLGKIGSEKQLPRLKEMTKDENEEVRRSAFKAVNKIKGNN